MKERPSGISGVISKVRPGSPAREMGLEPGDRIIAVNGKRVFDYIDYRFETSGELVEIHVQKASGEEWVIEFEKDYDEDLGIVFEEDLFDGLKECRNGCVFCFVRQMPRGMRKTLYLRDDDYRLSFLHGNFITLTNITEDEFQRIIAQRLSPLYISVHATNPDVRQALMRTPRARDIMLQLKRLANAGIHIHAQFVLCPGLNDGPELDRSLADLNTLQPAILSIAVVPVGLTRHRKDMQGLRPYTGQEAGAVISQVAAWQERFLGEHGRRVVYAADEFFVLAGEDIPPADYYEGFPQLQNGIGLLRLFLDQFHEAARGMPKGPDRLALPRRRLTVVTGRSAATTMTRLAKEAAELGVDATVFPVTNDFFGHTVTVAGLLTGQDIIGQLRKSQQAGHDLGEEILLPEVLLRDGQGDLLDGVRPEEIARALDLPVRVIGIDGREFLAALLNRSAA